MIATVDDVASLTGVRVTDPALLMAHAVVEVYAGRPQEVWAHLKPSDQRSLKLATAYQAAWMDAHPEAFSTMDVTSAAQLDHSFAPRDADSLTLAPLAKRVLARLSWRGIRSVAVSTDLGHSEFEPEHDWRPL